MTKFRYYAIHESGRRFRREVDAPSEGEFCRLLAKWTYEGWRHGRLIWSYMPLEPPQHVVFEKIRDGWS